MIQSIEQYLSQLKKELAGCDRATIQDALADAEEYLRTALNGDMADTTVAEAEALARVIEKYGAPQEIAAAYREIEHRLTPALVPVKTPVEPEEPVKKDERSFLAKFFGVFADPVTWGSFLYLLFSLATGIIYFTWVVTGISLSAGLMVLIIGLPVAGLFILSVRGLGLVEGRIVEALLGVRMPRRQLYSPRNLSWWQRFKNIVADKQTWFSIVYMLLQMPLGVTYFTVFITLIALSISGIVLPILQLGYGVPFQINNVEYYLAAWVLPFTVIGGILLAILTMHLARWVGRFHGMLAKAMLVRA